MSDLGYVVLFILHVVSFTAAFGPVLTYSVLVRRAVKEPTSGAALAETGATVNNKVVLPALLATIVWGFGLVGMSNGAFSLSDVWITASLSIALALVALLYFVLTPALQKLAVSIRNGSDVSASGADVKTVRIATAVYMVGFLVVVYLMTDKPG